MDANSQQFSKKPFPTTRVNPDFVRKMNAKTNAAETTNRRPAPMTPKADVRGNQYWVQD